MIRKFNTCYIWKEKKDEIRSEPIWTRNSISKCTNSPKSTAKAKAKSIYTNEIVANFHLNCIIIAPPLVSICNFSCVCVDCPYGHFLLLFVNFVPNFWLVQRKFHIIIGVDAIAAAINVNDKTLEVRKYDGKRKQRRWPIYWFHRVACRIWKKVYVHRTSYIGNIATHSEMNAWYFLVPNLATTFWFSRLPWRRFFLFFFSSSCEFSDLCVLSMCDTVYSMSCELWAISNCITAVHCVHCTHTQHTAPYLSYPKTYRLKGA